MQEIMKGNHKDPSGFLCGVGECNEVFPEPLSFSFQVSMPFSRNIFTILWAAIKSVICTVVWGKYFTYFYIFIYILYKHYIKCKYLLKLFLYKYNGVYASDEIYQVEHRELAATKVTGSKPKQGALWCYMGNMTFPPLATHKSAGQQAKTKSS